MSATTPAGHTRSAGVSIVLYRTPISAIHGLIAELLEQQVAHVYVIDNSTDSTETFRGWTPDERVTTLCSGGNLGYGRANNLAVRLSVSRYKYHLICNPDISLRPDTIGRLYEFMESQPQIGLCMPRVVGLDGSVQALCKRAPQPLDYLSGLLPFKGWQRSRRARLEMRDCPYDRQMDVECLSGCFMFFRSSVLAALQGFDERFFLYFEDFDLSRRARRMARNTYFPGAEVVHAYGGEHRRSLRVRMNFLASAIRYFNKWGWI